MGLLGTTLPVIKLYDGGVATHTITFADWLPGFDKHEVTFPEVVHSEVELVDGTFKKRLRGFRFRHEISFNDLYVPYNDSATGRKKFEWLMDRIMDWAHLASDYTVRDYYFADNADRSYYEVIVLEASKVPFNNGIDRTKAHQYRFVLVGRGILSAVPAPTSLPWVAPE